MVAKEKSSNSSQVKQSLNRRQFLAGTSAALTFTALKPELVRGTNANSKLRLGLFGCGNRGGWIAHLFRENGGYELTAVADYFQDRVDEVGNKYNIEKQHRYTGLMGYKRLLDAGIVDAVAIESPPYFHPEQAAAAVEAGCHVYLAKPIAVDTPGCHSIAASGKKASSKKLCFLIDFQTRADPFYQEALKLVHQGALGDFAFGESTYHAGLPWKQHLEDLKKNPDNPEVQLRAWGLIPQLSGDIITEQNIHTLDVMNWIMDTPPLSAYGTGGRKVRTVGDCWDNFVLTFIYPNNVGIAFSSRQFNGHGTQPEGIRNRMFGNLGVLETQYGGQVLIRGKNFYKGGKSPGIYVDGAVANIKTFHENIMAGKFDNPTVEPSVRSNLITILGRTAAYENRVVSWDELIKCKDTMKPNLEGLKA